MKKAMKINNAIKIKKVMQTFYLIKRWHHLLTRNKTQESALKMLIKASAMKQIRN